MTPHKVPILALRMFREKTMKLARETVLDSADAGAVAIALIGDRPVENVIAMMVDGRGRVTSVVTLAVGGMHGCGLTIRDVLRAALVAQASAFVLAHNHPSGDPRPSPEDVVFTKKVRLAADIVGVPLLDHVVVTRDGEFASVSDMTTVDA